MKKTSPAGGIAAFALALATWQAVAGRPGQDAVNAPTDEQVQITATRFGERIQEVPGSISAVTGDELRARGALDLRSALALMAGISVAPGGDAGPAGATPGLLGVREIDDLLLLIDGIPAGGAYTPQVEAVSLVNVERIEVLRGAAPVYYGTTAFAGTLNIIHYAAGKADSGFTLRAGSRRSVGASGAFVLSAGAVRQTLSGEISDDKVADRRAGYKRAQGSWRLGTEVAGGDLRADVNLLSLRQKPNSPSPFDDSVGQFAAQLPVDFNQNPANAKLDTQRYQLMLAYELPLAFGRWGSTLSYTQTQTDSIRGFIDMGDSPPPWTIQTVADLEAFSQSRKLRDLFVDTHLTGQPLPGMDLTAGVNLLLGRANAHSLRYAHTLLLNGVTQLPNIEAVASKGTVDLIDERRFIGLYAQSRYKLNDEASLLAGLRWNSTHEARTETRVNSRGVVTLLPGTQDLHRLSGSLGGQWKAWQDATGPFNALTLHASAGSTFQPAQIDFGPNPDVLPDGGGILKAETQHSLILGLKTDLWNGLAEIDIDGFVVDFNNQPIEANSAAGTAVLRAGGKQRYTGLEVEGLVLPAAGWTIRTHLAWTAAKYRDFFTLVDGAPTQLSGKQQVLTPTWRAGAGVVYAPERSWRGSLTTAWTGKHGLNRLNTAQAPAYAVVDASLGYRFEACTLQLSATNLGDRRDATQQSELGEDQFYRLPARRFDVSLSVPFR